MKTAVQQLSNHRRTVIISGLLCLVAAYLLASRAVHTGSLQQYGLTLVFMGLAIRQLVRLVRMPKS